MHIQITDQETGATLALCIERASKTCLVLRGDLTLLSRAEHLAEALKASAIRAVVGEAALEDMLAAGWTVVPQFLLMQKTFKEGVNPDGEFQTPGSLVRNVSA